jgi:hypothetical protein
MEVKHKVFWGEEAHRWPGKKRRLMACLQYRSPSFAAGFQNGLYRKAMPSISK